VSHPKWVQREPTIGAVLCMNQAEEDALLLDWEERKLAAAQAGAAAAQAAAQAAQSQGEVTIPAGKSKK
jgi:hypothetical protein